MHLRMTHPRPSNPTPLRFDDALHSLDLLRRPSVRPSLRESIRRVFRLITHGTPIRAFLQKAQAGRYVRARGRM